MCSVHIPKANSRLAFTFLVKDLEILRHVKGMGGSFDFVTKCDKGWVGCFCSVMSHFLHSSIFSTICFILAS